MSQQFKTQNSKLKMTLYPKLITDALATVIYAGTKKNLIESNMLADDVRINGMKVKFTLVFPRDTDPFMKSTIKAAEAAIHYHVSKDVEVTIETEFLSKPRPEVGKLLPQVKNVIAVSSGKGGVGKSTVAANLAIALARLGYKVGLLDCDIFGPSVPKMFQVEDARPYAVKKDGRDLIEPIEKYGIKLLSIGFFVNPNTATLWRGGMASNALKQLIADADWGELDYFVLDTPPGTSDIHLTAPDSRNHRRCHREHTAEGGARRRSQGHRHVRERQGERAYPRTRGEHGVVHTSRTAREQVLHLRQGRLQAACAGEGLASARPDTARAGHLREWRRWYTCRS